jgi:protein ImuB
LKGMGIDQLGQLRHLPRDGVSKRFGTALFDEMDRAYGDAPDPRNWFVAPAEFRARLELHARVESADALFFAAHRLLIQLTGWLCAKQSALRSFTLLLNHETRRNEVPQASIVITLAQASRDLAHLSLLLREHLARTTLAAPVVEIVLHATHVEPLETTNQDLFPSATTSTENLGRLLERLGARLGMQAIRRVRLLEDHRPEIAQRFEAALQSTNPRLSRQSAPVADPDHHLSYVSPRPSWLLSRPLRLTVRDHKPFHHCRLHLVAGPERIEAGWWDATAVRDYFVAENDDAELLWVFRERLTGGNESWYLHGKFA